MQTQDKNEIELLNCWREITEHEKEIVLNFIKKLAESESQEIYKKFTVIK